MGYAPSETDSSPAARSPAPTLRDGDPPRDAAYRSSGRVDVKLEGPSLSPTFGAGRILVRSKATKPDGSPWSSASLTPTSGSLFRAGRSRCRSRISASSRVFSGSRHDETAAKAHDPAGVRRAGAPGRGAQLATRFWTTTGSTFRWETSSGDPVRPGTTRSMSKAKQGLPMRKVPKPVSLALALLVSSGAQFAHQPRRDRGLPGVPMDQFAIQSHYAVGPPPMPFTVRFYLDCGASPWGCARPPRHSEASA